MAKKGTTRYYSKKQETYVADILGGNIVANSGAANFVAGDVVIPDLMIIECKTTTKDNCKSFSIKKDWIEQNEKERMGLLLPYNALAISMTSKGDNNYYVINEKLMKKLVSFLKGDDE